MYMYCSVEQGDMMSTAMSEYLLSQCQRLEYLTGGTHRFVKPVQPGYVRTDHVVSFGQERGGLCCYGLFGHAPVATLVAVLPGTLSMMSLIHS